MILAFFFVCLDAASRMNRENFFDFVQKGVDAQCGQPRRGSGSPLAQASRLATQKGTEQVTRRVAICPHITTEIAIRTHLFAVRKRLEVALIGERRRRLAGEKVADERRPHP